jgi:hypothetical protein
MRSTRISAIFACVLAVSTAAAFAQDKAAAGKAVPADNQPAPMIMLVPIEISDPAMKNGCWAQLYDERNFQGEMLTIAGPMQIDTTDKAGGRQLRRSLDSLTTGPKATLTVFERKLFKDKSVVFGPNSREGGLIKKLGFTGSIESLKLDCNK